MASIQDELQELRTQLASLTARIYRLELSVGVEQREAQAASTLPTREVNAGITEPPPATAVPSTPRIAPTARRVGPRDLEGTIGKLWLNRIGIIAILIGVAYF